MRPADASTSYERARRILASRQPPGWIALLAVVEAILGLLLLVDLGLVIELLDARGEARLRADEAAGAPAWIRQRLPKGPLPSPLDIPNTGLTPILMQNRRADALWSFRMGAAMLGPILAHVRPLRANLSALLCLLSVGLALLLTLVLVVQGRRRLVVRATVEAAASLRRQIHRQLYRLGRSALPGEGVGPVVNLFTREVNDVREALQHDLESVVRAPLVAIGLLLIALALSPPLTIFVLSLFTLVGLAARPLRRATRDEADSLTRAAATQLLLLHEDLGLVRTVRVFGMEAYDKERFDAHLAQYRRAEEQRLRAEGGLPVVTVLLYGMAVAVGLGLLGWTVLLPTSRSISPAAALVLGACLLGATRLAALWRESGRARRRAMRSAGVLFEYLDRRPDLLMPPEAQFLAPLSRAITFENVTLERAHGRPLLSGISLEIPAGSRTAIVGRDEDEKLTLACLIPRLIDPDVGRVRIDGHDLRAVTLESLRAQVATVFQADLAFSDTVLANIALGDPNHGLPRVIEAAKSAHAHHFIQNLPDGYETIIGPLGHPLGPDQLYRIGLARVFLHDPSIVIIEEPTRPIGDQIKPLVDDAVDQLWRGRTLVFLPHRLSTIRKCDMVVILRNGRIEDVGPPRELSRRSRLYRHLQYVEFNQLATGEPEAGVMKG